MTTRRARLTTIFLLLVTAFILGFLILSNQPGVGASLAKPLRGIIGNEGVAQLETIFFTVQDTVKQSQYRLGLAEAAAPWQAAEPLPTDIPLLAVATTLPSTVPTATLTPSPTPLPAATQPTPSAILAGTQVPTPTASATPFPTPSPWALPALTPFGTLENEGRWQPYLTNEAGEVVALRTFLQPDPERPYAIAAIVAFDLRQIRLHYVLGSEEPALANGPRGHGFLPEADREVGRLLATFNGGFMASHGQYGAMAAGLEALPAKPGYATLTIGDDGRVQIGEWGNDIEVDGSYFSWRQNARLVTQEGEINERVYNGSAATWGSSIDGEVVTWRSGLGIDETGITLYFVAGPSLSMPSLATTFQVIGAYNSLLLDINETWVHFAAIQSEDGALKASPLLPEGMDTNPDRYLRQSARDFFYVTAAP